MIAIRQSKVVLIQVDIIDETCCSSVIAHISPSLHFSAQLTFPGSAWQTASHHIRADDGPQLTGLGGAACICLTWTVVTRHLPPTATGPAPPRIRAGCSGVLLFAHVSANVGRYGCRYRVRGPKLFTRVMGPVSKRSIPICSRSFPRTLPNHFNSSPIRQCTTQV